MNLFKSILLYNNSLFQDISNKYKIPHYVMVSIIYYSSCLPEKYYVMSDSDEYNDNIYTYFNNKYSTKFCKTITSKYNIYSLINSNGDKGWYRYGKLNRNIHPAKIVLTNSSIISFWYKYGKFERKNGLPSKIIKYIHGDVDKIEFWYQNSIVVKEKTTYL